VIDKFELDACAIHHKKAIVQSSFGSDQNEVVGSRASMNDVQQKQH
jgi:hypothetical protein